MLMAHILYTLYVASVAVAIGGLAMTSEYVRRQTRHWAGVPREDWEIEQEAQAMGGAALEPAWELAAPAIGSAPPLASPTAADLARAALPQTSAAQPHAAKALRGDIPRRATHHLPAPRRRPSPGSGEQRQAAGRPISRDH